jgi:DNA-directed RNA polymerase specialized sigma24 family protein
VKALIDDLVDAIDEARSPLSDDGKHLYEVMRRYVASRVQGYPVSPSDFNDVSQNVALSIVALMAKGQTSIAIAKQVPIIVQRRIIDFRKSRACEIALATDDVAFAKADALANQNDDFDHVILEDEIRPLLAALEHLKDVDLYSYEAIRASLEGEDVAKHLTSLAGRNVTPDAARKTRERGREKLAQFMSAEVK